jgi:HD-GYP domain-containing protein (c-di-GMP phosphodiesterase class II)
MDEVFERWDGLGGPRGVAGEEISLVGRLAACAHCAILFLLDGDLQDAQQVLAVRSGAVLDPVLGRRAGALLGPFAAAPVEEQALAAERVLQAEPLPLDLLTLARTFGDFADLQLPFARGHSRRVAEACERAAAALGLPAEERRDLLLAAHLHDIGQIAVPTGCWLRPRWSPADRQRAQAHASFTEQVLRASAPLAGAARIAGAHHELLDGSGYPRGRRGPFLDAAARILATSDVLCALREPRPHRAAMSREQAASVLQEEGRARRLDAGVIEALLDGRGGSRARPAEAPRLTPRELEVVRLLARGRTNKEIAVALGISARTVQHHTLHIYEKFGVDTRAAATLQALHLGLLEGVDDR